MFGDLTSIIDPAIQPNTYFAHFENILVGMTNHKNPIIRNLAHKRNLKARTQRRGDIRKISMPQLDFQTETDVDLIKWQDIEITEPPVVYNIEIDGITDYEIGLEPLVYSIYHNQFVERCVKLMTEASLQVCRHHERKLKFGVSFKLIILNERNNLD